MCCLCAFTLFTSQRSTVYPGCPSQGRGPRIFFPETRNVPRLHYCKSRGHKPRIIPVQYERVNSYRCANCIASRCRVSSYYTATQHAAVPGTSYGNVQISAQSRYDYVPTQRRDEQRGDKSGANHTYSLHSSTRTRGHTGTRGHTLAITTNPPPMQTYQARVTESYVRIARPRA